MKIEIAEPGRMTQSGSSLLKLIQNNSMPILDLLVRESIQNSLDASNKIGNYVKVNFITGGFSANELNLELEGISDSLNKRFSGEKYEYLAIRDSNTVGLTGPLHYDEVQDNNYGNLLKLVYEISKPQEASGAGGSWGLGKTVYFRLGIGLVIYYSRIRKDNGDYESRLVATLVENERDPQSIIPSLPNKSKRGIAWWGEQIDDNKTRPITDEKEIHRLLSIFNISPYYNEETGTTIIIPYINSKKLLQHNKLDFSEENQLVNPYWYNSINEYLNIAIQRWYAPRLNNSNYPYGKYLNVSINDESIQWEPIFKVIQALYNRAMTGNIGVDDILVGSESQPKVEKIILRNIFTKSDVGVISYVKLNKELLKMNPPHNKYSPFLFINSALPQTENNKPLITFTRKPGMLVAYETLGPWVDGIPVTSSDEYIVGIFVLNSNNTFSGFTNNVSLEEYIRKSEMADHTSWIDFNFNNKNLGIISKIQKHIVRKISKEFSVNTAEDLNRKNSGLGRLLGDLVLPPENFGSKASKGSLNKQGNPRQTSNAKGKMTTNIDFNNIKFYEDYMEIPILLISNKPQCDVSLTLGIQSQNGLISIPEWESSLGIDSPFSIKEVNIEIISINNSRISHSLILSNGRTDIKIEDYSLEVKMIASSRNNNYSITLNTPIAYKFQISLLVKLKLNRRDMKPIFQFNK